MSTVSRIPGTNRQSVTAADGTQMQRQYVYLPPSVWASLQASARLTGTSVSQLIAAFATSGTVNSKEKHDRNSTRSN